MSNHDDHYKNFEKVLGNQPITVMEAVVCNGIPEEFHEQAKRNLLVAMAIKYLLRLGHKDEASKEINKAENFLHRARTGSWRPEGVKPATPTVINPWCSGCIDEKEEAAHCFACRSNGYILRSEHPRGPMATVTTHGKTAEATEEEVGKVAAELKATPSVVPRNCASCNNGPSARYCTEFHARKCGRSDNFPMWRAK